MRSCLALGTGRSGCFKPQGLHREQGTFSPVGGVRRMNVILAPRRNEAETNQVHFDDITATEDTWAHA